jgi:diketogulonate reductase-like aldo/keto reductase
MATTARKLTDVLPLATTSPRQIPQIGLGTYLSPPERTLNSCLAALKAGYRQVDTGQYYENEGEVGQAIQQSGIPREEVFVTTKILFAGESVEENYASCIKSVEKLGGYVDCFLIHSPSPGPQKRKEMWLALEKLYQEGKAKSIGVSNFGVGQIEGLKGAGSVWPPHVLQIEVSPIAVISDRCHFFTDLPLASSLDAAERGRQILWREGHCRSSILPDSPKSESR